MMSPKVPENTGKYQLDGDSTAALGPVEAQILENARYLAGRTWIAWNGPYILVAEGAENAMHRAGSEKL